MFLASPTEYLFYQSALIVQLVSFLIKVAFSKKLCENEYVVHKGGNIDSGIQERLNKGLLNEMFTK